jgi:hypothetical protein
MDWRELSRDLFSMWSALRNDRTVFSVRGPCREDMREYENRNLLRPQSSLCGGGVEYLHRDPASRRRRRKGKSQI